MINLKCVLCFCCRCCYCCFQTTLWKLEPVAMINLKVVLCHQSWRKIATSKVEMRNSDPTMQCAFWIFKVLKQACKPRGMLTHVDIVLTLLERARRYASLKLQPATWVAGQIQEIIIGFLKIQGEITFVFWLIDWLDLDHYESDNSLRNWDNWTYCND